MRKSRYTVESVTRSYGQPLSAEPEFTPDVRTVTARSAVEAKSTVESQLFDEGRCVVALNVTSIR